MSTRCNVSFYDQGEHGWKDGPILYRHSDGYPEYMLPTLERLSWAIARLREASYCVDSEKLAAMLVADSVSSKGIPAFYPCCRIHDDIEYRYDVYVDVDSVTIEAKSRHGHLLNTVAVEIGGVA